MTDGFGLSPIAHGVSLPGATPVVPGFRLLQLVERDELGDRYRAEEVASRSERTLRIIAGPLSDGQRAALSDLWTNLSFLPPHPGLAQVIGHGVTGEGAPWVATDASATASLADQIATGRPSTALELMEVARQLARALEFLHEEGLVHGGISPSAVVRDETGWRLTDVGLATLILRPPSPDAMAVSGVMAYAAPEVLAGHRPTPAADVCSLGLTIVGAAGGTVGTTHLPPEAPAFADQLVWDACHWEPRIRASAASLSERLREISVATEAHQRTESPSHVFDDDVQFTVYRPATVRPERWYTMLAFAHKSDAPDPDTSSPDPRKEVHRQADLVLGDEVDRYVTATEDAGLELERGSELTFVPEMEGIEFNPPQSSFQWEEPVHRVDFALRASPALNGRRARGRLSVYFGALLVAEVNLTIPVNRLERSPHVRAEPTERESARPYRKIFASYSHRDQPIVEEMARWAAAMGDEFLRDCTHLRAGEVWTEGLQGMIRDADVFQLFWSTNSIMSSFVRQEWEYALSLERESFIRPCYWEDPLPVRPEEDLPPVILQRLHFQRVAFAASGRSDPIAPDGTARADVSREPYRHIPSPQQIAPPTPLPEWPEWMGPPPPAMAPPQATPARAQSTAAPPGSVPEPPPAMAPLPSPAAEAPRARGRRRTGGRRVAAVLAGLGSLVIATALGSGFNVGSTSPEPASQEPPVALREEADAPPLGAFLESRQMMFALRGGATPTEAATVEEWKATLNSTAARRVQGCIDGRLPDCETMLRVVADECQAGFPLSCDVLTLSSPRGSVFRQYGMTCGGRFSVANTRSCQELARDGPK